MGRHSKPNPLENSDVFYERLLQAMTEPIDCPEHADGIHYYAPISIDEGQCSCGVRIRQNNSGH